MVEQPLIRRFLAAAVVRPATGLFPNPAILDTMHPIEQISFPLGIGTGKLRSLIGGLSSRAAVRLLMRAMDEGIRFFDTAPLYGQGQAEDAIGRLPDAVKQQLCICSKVGYSFGRKTTVINLVKPVLQPAAKYLGLVKKMAQGSREMVVSHGGINIDIEPATIRSSLAGTLRRLQREQLDLLLLHDASLESLSDDNLKVLNSLQQAGDIGRWGVATGDVAVARTALGLENLAALELPVEPGWVAGAEDVFTAAKSAGVAIIANRVLSPLQSTNGTSGAQQANSVDRVAQCFEYALARPGVRIVLNGTTNIDHLSANVRSMRRVLGGR